MFSLKKIRNQAGVTLVELLVAMSLLGGIALVTAKLMDDQAASQNHLKAMAAISGAINKVEQHLNNPAHCKWMLGGKTVPSTIASNLIIYKDAATTVNIIGPGNYQMFSVPANGMRLENSIYGATVADLVLDFQVTNKTAFANKRDKITRRIPVVVQMNAGAIQECGPILSDANTSAEKQMCDTLRGTSDPDLTGKGAVYWDAASTPPRCRLNSVKCPYGKVATRLTSLGGIICEDIQTQVNLEELFDTTGVNCSGVSPLNIRIIQVGGKFKVTCY